MHVAEMTVGVAVMCEGLQVGRETQRLGKTGMSNVAPDEEGEGCGKRSE